MLQIKDLSIYMKNDGRPLVERLTINLNSNDKVAVIIANISIMIKIFFMSHLKINELH